MEGRFSIALTGCGRISEKHIEAIRANPKFELVGVCDVVESLARSAGEKHGVPWFRTQADMLKAVKPQVVTLSTPSGLHAQHGIEAARCGAHVVVEKPIATSLPDADRLIEACESQGRKLFVVKLGKLYPAARLLKTAVDKGRFGRLYLVNTTIRWQRPQSYYDEAAWRGTRHLDGGAFMNQASHYVDLILWLAGPAESVIAKTATLARHIETEDVGAAVLKFRSGALGVLEVNMLTYPKNLEGSVTLIGEKGTVKVGGTALDRIEVWRFADPDPDDRRIEEMMASPQAAYVSGHKKFFENVADVLEGKAQPETDGREGRKSLELIIGIYESSREGREISLPLRNFL